MLRLVGGWAAVQLLYAFLGNGSPHALPTALRMGVGKQLALALEKATGDTFVVR
ncbi:MAG TPA: hypothetical protein VFS43_03595 [Polyangiaceae bacterium]|nr:hypothetical protein [Polyangiaceae bacterium]